MAEAQDKLNTALSRLEAAARAGEANKVTLQATLARSAAAQVQAELKGLRLELARSRLLMERTVSVTLAEGVQPVAERVLDGMMAVVGAARGFVGLLDGDGWRFLVARNLAQDDIGDPAAQVSASIIDRCLQTRETVVAEDALQELGTRSVQALRLRSIVCLPLAVDGRPIGFVYLDDPDARGVFDGPALAAVRAWLPVVGALVDRAEPRLPSAGLPGVLTRSPVLLSVLDNLRRVARYDASVLLTGETGTGKSLIARSLHSVSARAAGPFIHINCGAIPEALVEGELFGAEAGAYTGSQGRRIGKFEAACGGTLFLDELDSLPLACQVKLLVAVQERRITRLGSNKDLPIDVRLIAAMSSDPAEAIRNGKLREDLYYRLAVYVARIPPLRERLHDVPMLARHMLARAASRFELPALSLSPQAEAELQRRTWPGNIRELENAIERAALLAEGGRIEVLPSAGGPPAPPSDSPAQGIVAELRGLARRFVGQTQLQGEPLDLSEVDGWKGAVLLGLIEALGGREQAFEALGMRDQVANKNHHRIIRREVGRLQALARRLGEAPPPLP